eukprot:Sspe_Gene.93436::Locus_66074_Transcript_1_1_Confidence_1.000_Length_1545::g.93436::m.93436
MKHDRQPLAGKGLFEGRHEVHLQQLGELKESVSLVDHATSVPVPDISADQLATSLNLKMTPAGLYTPGAPPNLTSLEGLRERLMNIQRTTVNQDRVRIFKAFLDNLIVKTAELMQAATSGQLSSDGYTAPLTTSIDLLEDFITQRRPQDETSALDAELAERTKKLDAVSKTVAEQEQLWTTLEYALEAVKGPEVKRKWSPSEPRNNTQLERHRWLTEKYDDIFNHLDRSLSIIRKKAARLEMLETRNAAYKERTAEVREVAMRDISSLQYEVETMMQRCQDDVEVVEDRIRTAHVEHDEAMKAHNEWLLRNDDALQANEDRQHSTWAKLFELEDELCRLSSERRDLVQRRCLKVKTEMERRCSLEKWHQQALQNLELLRNQIHNGRLALSILCHGRENVVNGISKAITAQRKCAKQQLHSLILSTRQTELEMYGKLHKRLGELQVKKEMYLDKLQLGMTSSWQVQLLYGDMQKQLQGELEALKKRQAK